MTRFFIAAALLGAAAGAQAHITLEQPSAEAGTYYKAVLRVGHGCEGSPTQALTVTLPPGALHAHPMPKPGWTLAARTDPASGAVTQWAWQGGSLADAHYDEFVLRVKLPAQPGPLWFRVHQQCAQGANDWAEVPASGTDTRGLKRPAALLDVRPAAAPAHAHAH
ncbi:MAG: YcnI family protein [Ottowia sp.]|uniref:YcnI family copper-binding membrane protein n=1 Tax=Ottowia sp. TaxID=1898956 RepID=UPI0039E59366